MPFCFPSSLSISAICITLRMSQGLWPLRWVASSWVSPTTHRPGTPRVPSILDIEQLLPHSNSEQNPPKDWHLIVKQKLPGKSLTTSSPTTRYRIVSSKPRNAKWRGKKKEERKRSCYVSLVSSFLLALCLKEEPCLQFHILNILILD